MRNKKTHRLGLAAFFAVLVFFTGCEPIVLKSDDDTIKDDYLFTGKKLSNDTKIALANVDYHNINKNATIFFSFKDKKIYEIPHDSWDIAITTDKEGNAFVVSNSGSYGASVRVLPHAKKLKNDYYVGKPLKAIQQVSFKNGKKELSPYQNDPDTGTPVANPLHNDNALTDERKYYVLTETAIAQSGGSKTEHIQLFRISFVKMTAPKAGDAFTLNVEPCSIVESAGGKKLAAIDYAGYTVTGTISEDYSFTYIKLKEDSGTVVTESEWGAVPKKHEWDLMFTRTNIYSPEMGEVLKNDGIIGTSSILINTAGGAEAAPLYGWDYPEVTAVPQAKYFRSAIDTIGSGYSTPLYSDPELRRKAWYYAVTMPPTFYLSRITYVVKCAGGGYGKFRPGTFYGPNGEMFYVKFRYSYTP